MRRKRRNPGTWFPMLGREVVFGEDVIRFNPITGIINLPNTSEPLTVVLPLTFDVPQEENSPDNIDQTLSEIMGSEYIIKRILGSLLVSVTPSANEGDAPTFCEVGAGFFVGRAESPAGGDINWYDFPIGYSTGGNNVENFSNYGPLSSDNVRQPWMWRRCWPLNNTTNVGDEWDAAQWPRANWMFNNLNLSPAVDIKSRRRVRHDERLWLAISAHNVGVGGVEPIAFQVRYWADLRMFGQLVKAKNDGNF